jgi:MinD superfamily P-loop ATPase
MSARPPGAKPRELVVLSGKGGTGKTSVVAALASLADHTVLADCDVDAPDLHLVLAPVRLKKEPFFSGYQARIDADRCSQCGDCRLLCRFEAVRLVPANGQDRDGGLIHSIDPLACEGCGLCELACPDAAIETFEPQRGELFLSDTRHGPLVHARLFAGGENSGKLVSLVRERARELAEQAGAPFVLVDGPPGIGCPVIASVTGADLVLLVTEPSVSGLHDLQRVVELAKGFGRPLAVCINRWDINPDMAAEIEKRCVEWGAPVVARLDYDPGVARAQTDGKSIIEYGRSPVARQIAEMWDSIQAMLMEARV